MSVSLCHLSHSRHHGNPNHPSHLPPLSHDHNHLSSDSLHLPICNQDTFIFTR
jgi:hypothetical protein